MNSLHVGTNKTFDIDFSSNFLLIDDGTIIDSLHIPTRRSVTHFDVSKHCLNPLQGMDYRRARNFVSIINAIFPEGENTLARKNSTFALLIGLLNKPKSLDALFRGLPLPLRATPEAMLEAQQKIDTLLFSPVLKKVLANSNTSSLGKVVLARLDRALGDFDAFVIASFLVSQFKGQVIIPDFGFYGREFHTSLIRENRLTAGINFFDELSPSLKNTLLTIPTKTPQRALFEDAEVLANHAGHLRGTNAYNDFIKEAME